VAAHFVAQFRGAFQIDRSPVFQAPRVVLSSVSSDTSTANQPSFFSTTVRQQPAWLIEAPMSMLETSQPVSIS
jgi:hypothetical protein